MLIDSRPARSCVAGKARRKAAALLVHMSFDRRRRDQLGSRGSGSGDQIARMNMSRRPIRSIFR